MQFDFDEPTDLGVFVCTDVLNGARVARVTHDQAGDWVFECEIEHPDSADHYHLACLEHVVEDNQNVNDIASMPRGFAAIQDRGTGEWVSLPLSDDEQQV